MTSFTEFIISLQGPLIDNLKDTKKDSLEVSPAMSTVYEMYIDEVT